MSKEAMNELLKKLKNAKTDDERRQIIEHAKSSLTDEELETVSGGTGAYGSWTCDVYASLHDIGCKSDDYS